MCNYWYELLNVYFKNGNCKNIFGRGKVMFWFFYYLLIFLLIKIN